MERCSSGSCDRAQGVDARGASVTEHRARTLPRSAWPSPDDSRSRADRVLGRGHRHHLGLRRPDPARHLPLRPRAQPTASPPPRWPSASSCTPTSPATTSTSWPPAATSRSRAGTGQPAAPAGRRSATASTERAMAARVPGPPRRPARHAARPGARAAPAGRGRGDGRGGRRRVRPGRWPPIVRAGGDPAPVVPRRRCTPWPTPSPPTASPPTPRARRRPAADRLRALPVRRRRHRAPGDLRRRPRAWCKGMLGALYGETDAGDRRRRWPSATTSASPPFDRLSRS